jgi:hypothetical protein
VDNSALLNVNLHFGRREGSFFTIFHPFLRQKKDPGLQGPGSV